MGDNLSIDVRLAKALEQCERLVRVNAAQRKRILRQQEELYACVDRADLAERALEALVEGTMDRDLDACPVSESEDGCRWQTSRGCEDASVGYCFRQYIRMAFAAAKTVPMYGEARREGERIARRTR